MLVSWGLVLAGDQSSGVTFFFSRLRRAVLRRGGRGSGTKRRLVIIARWFCICLRRVDGNGKRDIEDGGES